MIQHIYSVIMLVVLTSAAGFAYAGGNCNTSADCQGLDECCLGACRDISSNWQFCGSCTNVCSPTEICLGGQCACSKGDGLFELCSTTELCCPGVGCRALDSDPQNCGACGLACGQGEVCVDERCRCGTASSGGGPVCTSGNVCCGLPASCRSPEVCVCGTTSCIEGQQCCDQNGVSICVNNASNNLHCGSCGNECALGETCDGSGVCRVVCPIGTTNCGGHCVNLLNDTNNCGACNSPCPPGEICGGQGECVLTCQPGIATCAGECIDFDNDRNNCGACGQVCPPGEICSGGGYCELTCQLGLTECVGECIDFDNDRNNCGACGRGCPPGEICDGGGECEITCQPGLTDCSGKCVDLDQNQENCGTCDYTCTMGKQCVDSTCEIVCPLLQVVCGIQCVNTFTDAANCGSCGNQCPVHHRCEFRICALDCPPPLSGCGDQCFDLKKNLANCGACDVACPPGWECDNGNCNPPCASLGTADCGDFDLDIVVTDQRPPTGENLRFLRNDGAGLFTAGGDSTVCDMPGPVAVADMNGDTRPDLVIACLSSDTSQAELVVQLSVGDMAFGKPFRTKLNRSPTSILIGDFVRDPQGTLDVVVADEDVAEFHVFQGLGDGTLREPIRHFIGPISAMAAGDVSGDGVLDLVVLLVGRPVMMVLKNDEGGKFSVLQELDLSRVEVITDVVLFDLDQRNGPDIAVAAPFDGEVLLFANRGEGEFEQAASVSVSSEPTLLEEGRFNNDLLTDIAVANPRSNDIVLLLNDGNGGLVPQPPFAEVFSSQQFAAIKSGDIDGNGSLDLVALSPDGTLQPLINTGNGSFIRGTPVLIGVATWGLGLGDFESASSCTDLSTNPIHCGACLNECLPDEYCRAGECVLKADINNSGDVELEDYRSFQEVFGGPR